MPQANEHTVSATALEPIANGTRVRIDVPGVLDDCCEPFATAHYYAQVSNLRPPEEVCPCSEPFSLADDGWCDICGGQMNKTKPDAHEDCPEPTPEDAPASAEAPDPLTLATNHTL